MAPTQSLHKQSTRRLVAFVLGFLLLVALVESGVRMNADLFAGASEKGLAELAIFQKKPHVDLLFFGTSRTLGGVSPEIVCQSLREIDPTFRTLSGFNAAFPGSSIAMLTSVGPRFAVPDGPKLAVIELSAPQITNASAAWEEYRPTAVTLEDKIADSLQSLYCVRYRSALTRLPSLISYTWSLKLLGTNGITPVTSSRIAEESPVPFDPIVWTPEIISPDAAAHELSPTNELIANKLVFLSEQLRKAGLRVVFSIPPLTRRELQSAPEKLRLKPVFAELARRSRCEVWDFNARTVPDACFYNPSHLNSTGRAHYSRAIAIQLARVMKD